MMVQLDGSPHDWFEGRGPSCTLIIYIDDADSRVSYGEFVDEEDTFNLMRTTKTHMARTTTTITKRTCRMSPRGWSPCLWCCWQFHPW